MMLQIERLQVVEELLNKEGSISIADLEGKLPDISRATIYRDLKVLHNQGKLKFTRGGVTRPMYATNLELPYIAKRSTNTEEKRRIAEAACEFIKPNATIFLDSSTSVIEMNNYIANMSGIQVITNDVLIASELSTSKGIEVFVLGGLLRSGYYTLTGLFTHNNLAGIQIDTAFLSCDAINIRSGCMLTNIEEVEFKKKVMMASNECIVLCDHSKFNKSAFMSFCGVDQIDNLLVGKELDESIYGEFCETGVNISLV